MGKSTTWRPKREWKNNNKANNHNNSNNAATAGTTNTSEGGVNQQQPQNTAATAAKKKGVPFPKHCRGLVHVALCVAYTGVPFRGLQLQTYEHLSHTVEGQLLIALKRCGYLLDEDFTEDGSKLRPDGGIRIVVNPPREGGDGDDGDNNAANAAEEKMMVGEKTHPTGQSVADDDNANAATASEAAAAPVAAAEENGTTNGATDATHPTAAAAAPYYPPHVHKHVVPAHLHAHMSKRQRKKYDPNFNPDGKFHFARSCRTDKGVHAVRNIVSLYLREEHWRRDGNEGMMRRINESLPIIMDRNSNNDDNHDDNDVDILESRQQQQQQHKIMEVLAVTPVLPSFNPKECCNSRVYRYLIPLYALGFPSTTMMGSTSNSNSNVTAGTTGGVEEQKETDSEKKEENEEDPVEKFLSSQPLNYFNGAAIDDWERLFESYPELLAKGKDLAGKLHQRSSASSSSTSAQNAMKKAKNAVTTWLPNASELLRGHGALVAEAVAADKEEEEAAEDGEDKDEVFDHPILRQLVEYCNHFLHHQYVGASKRFHNFSATALDGEALGHRNSAAAKQLRGDDNEASRCIRRCEISPSIIWLRGPPSYTSASATSTCAAATDANNNNCAVKSDHNSSTTTGTREFLIGGDFGAADIISSSSSSFSSSGGQQQQQQQDPAEALYDIKLKMWADRKVGMMTTINGNDNTTNDNAATNAAPSSSASSSSSPPLLPFVVFQVDGQSFLLNMIRKLVGFMLAVVRGGRPWWLPELLRDKQLVKMKKVSCGGKGDDEEVDEDEKKESAAKQKELHEAYLASQRFADRCAFNGYCRPSLLPDSLEATLTVQTPLAPGPYLSLMQSKYTAYDMGVRAMANRSTKRRAKEERQRKIREAKAAAAAAKEGENGGGDAETAAAAQLLEEEGGEEFIPYYVTDVVPISDAWSNNNSNKTTAQKKKESDDNNSYAATSHLLGEKRPRSTGEGETPAEECRLDQQLTTAASSSTTAPSNPYSSVSSVEASAESFYWNVIATDIAAWDANIFLTDIDVSLALRDGKRFVREEKEKEAKSQKEKETDADQKEEQQKKTDSEDGNTAAVAPPSTSAAAAAVAGDDPLLQRLCSYPAIPPTLAANPKLLTRIKLQRIAPTRCGEMTLFLRGLRVHNWHVKTDDKVAQRLAQQHEQSVRNWEERKARAAALLKELLLAEEKRKEEGGGEEKAADATPTGDEGDNTAVLHNSGNDAATTTASAAPTASAPTVVNTATDATVGILQNHNQNANNNDNHQQQRFEPTNRALQPTASIKTLEATANATHFVSKAQLRREWQRDRHALDTVAVKKMLAERRQKVMSAAKNAAIVSHLPGYAATADAAAVDVENDDDDADNNDDDGDDDDSLLVKAPQGSEGNNRGGGGGGGGGNNKNNNTTTNSNNNNNNNGEEDLSNYSTFELHTDDGWWYAGTSAASRAHHRHVYKQAMVSVVVDRNKSTSRMP